MKTSTLRALTLLFAIITAGFSARAIAADPYISEFLASNTAGVADGDGDQSDWIEIFNPGPSSVDLQGWYLSNDPLVLTKWQFPNSLMLNSGAYVYVWASNKALVAGHSPDAGGRYHTNFSLAKSTGNLLLVKPDGTTIINQLAPAANPYAPYPSQGDNISYGVGSTVVTATSLLGFGATAKYFVPTAGNGGSGIQAAWMTPSFDDSTWNAGSTGIGYDTSVGGTGLLPNENEPNNTAATANNGTANFGAITERHQLSVTADIASAADVDFYRLGAMQTTAGGDKLSITISGAPGVRGTLANPVVELWRQNGATPVLVVSNDDGGPGLDAQIFEHVVTIADTYFVRVTGSGGTGTYVLGVFLDNKDTAPSSASTTTAEGETSPNTNNTTATAVDLSTSWRTAAFFATTNGLMGAGDIDNFKFSLAFNDILTVSATATSGVELRCSILNAAGTTVLASEDGTAASQGNNSKIFAFRVPSAAFYVVQIQSIGGTGTYSAEAWLTTTAALPPPSTLSTLIGKNIEGEMRTINPGVWMRAPFTVGDLSQVNGLFMKLRYKDGYVAYLNGNEVSRSNVGDAAGVAVASPTVPPYNGRTPAVRTTAVAVVPVEVDLTPQIALNNVQVGTNYLSIHTQIINVNSSTALMLPEMEYRTNVNGMPQYFVTVTPGAANTGGGLGQVADTKFSVNRGFYTTPQTVTITTTTGNATIRYTTNGDAPTATTGTAYSAPLVIGSTTVLRAAAFRTGYVPSNVDTQTYIFTTDVVNQQTTGTPPVGWPAATTANGDGIQNMDYGMDTAITNDPTWGPQMQTALNSIPSISVACDLTSLFGSTAVPINGSTNGIYSNPGGDGAAWERAASMEIVNPNNTPGTQINCGLRLRGGFSRSTDNPKHSLRFFFRDAYRGGGKLKYPLFGDAGASEFAKVDLRTSQNYSWAFGGNNRNIMNRDVFFRDLQREQGKPYTRSIYYHLYLNGQYWGLFQTQERSESDFGATYFGGESDEYDTIKVAPDGTQVGSNGFNSGYTIYATDGNFDAWDTLRRYCYNLLSAPGAPGAGMIHNANYFYLLGKNPDGSDNANYPVLLDAESLLDYMIGIYYGGNCDAPVSQFLSNNRPNNYYTLRRTSPQDVAFLPGNVPPSTRPLGKVRSEGFRFFGHDNEHTILSGTATGTPIQLVRNRVQDNNSGTQTATFVGSDPSFDQLQYSNPQSMHLKLMANAEYAQRFADRVQKAFFGNGVLIPTNNTARLNTRANQIATAIIAESARWGNAKTSPALTKNNWTTEINYLTGTYFPARSDTVLGHFRAASWFPAATNVGPTFTQYGGTIPAGGITLTIANPNPGGGTIYYTTNGSDPRLIGGTLNPAAIAGTSVAITENTTRIKARVLTAGVWSPMTDEVFAKTQTVLRVAEIMYNPGPVSPAEIAAGYADSEEFEFIEVINTSGAALNLEGAKFTVGLFYDFPAVTLAAGGRIVLVRNAAAFVLRYPAVTIGGQYIGDLEDGGERLVVADATGATILDFTYDNKWFDHTDGGGFSLTALDPTASSATLNTAAGWRASNAAAGSPSVSDTAVTPGTIVINEVLAYPNGGGDQFIELRNLSGALVDIGGWYLSDDAVNLTKYKIATGTTIAANGYLVFTASGNFNNAGDAGALTLFTVNRKLGAVFLSSGVGAAAGGYREDVDFSGSAQGVSLGRIIRSDSTTNFTHMAAVTNGAANSAPRVGPVVINELHYNPVGSGAEFVELFNNSTEPVVLDGWSFSEGVTYTFPAATSIAGYGYLVVTNGLPATVRTAYGIPVGTPVLGPWAGALDNAGETLRLSRPGDAMLDLSIPLISADHVKYDVIAPWPLAPNGTGPTLQRIDTTAYGNDVVNWASFVHTSGRLNFDTDGDGIPDAWEIANGMNPADAADAALDSDGDGASNYLEYIAGTNPQNAASVFRVDSVAPTGAGGAFVVTFTAQAGRTYTVQYRTSLGSGSWQKLADVAPSSAGPVSVPDPASLGEPNRFYRVVAPAQ